MIFAQFWWALLVFNSLGSNSLPMAGGQQDSEQLQSFSRAVDQAGPELQDLWSSFGDLPEYLDQMEHPRERRSALDTDTAKSPVVESKLADTKDTRDWQAEADKWYEDLQVQMAKRDAIRKRMVEKQERSLADSVSDEDMRVLGAQADAWYRDWMAQRARNGANQRRNGRKVVRSFGQEESKVIEQHDQAVKRPETVGATPKKASEEAIVQKPEQTQSLSQAKNEGAVASPDNVKLKNAPQTIGQQENVQAQSRMKVKAAPEKVNDPLAKLQESRNAPEPAGLFHQTKSNKLDHEANYKLSKIEQEASEKLPKLPKFDRSKHKKRRTPGVCDPMDEIKLKTSSRLIAKGFGPLLPSESFQITRKGKLEEWQNRMLDSTLGKSQYERMKNYDLPQDNYDTIGDVPQASDYKDPYDRFYSFDQPKKPNIYDFERPRREPKDVEIKSEPSLSTFSRVDLSESDQELSPKQAVEEPLAPEGQVKTNRVRSALEGEEDQNAPQQWMAVNTQMSDVNKATEAREVEYKETVQNMQQEYHGDSKLQRAALDKPSSFKGNEEEQLKADAKPLAPTINMNPEALSSLRDDQETRARRFPRRTRRVKRSLDDENMVTRHRTQMLDDFEDHNGNRVSFGVLGNGLLTPDSEELDDGILSFPGHELAYNELKDSQDDPLKNLASIENERPNTVYHTHEPLPGQPHTSNFKGHANFSQMNDIQKFLQVQQDILHDLIEFALKNADLIDPTKFKPKTQVARNLLRQYRDLPPFDQLMATDFMAQDLEKLLKTADDTFHLEREVFLNKVLEDVIKEQQNTKPSSRYLKFLKVAKLLKEVDGDKEQSWEMLAVE